jgi:serine protease
MIDPIFEGFSIWFRDSLHESDVQSLVTPVLGDGWEAEPFGDRTENTATRFDVTSAKHALSVSDAWQMTYQLRAMPTVLHAEPLFEAAIAGRVDWNAAAAPDLSADERSGEAVDPRLLMSGAKSKDLPESDDPEWSVKQIRILEAWARFFPDSDKLPGQGIVLGHPDTGYQAHPEIVANLLLDRGRDFLKDDSDPTDELEKPFGVLIANPGHGTGTSSVIISPRGDQTPDDGDMNFVTGVAPGAKLIPIRMTYSVVLVGMMKLAKSIEYAADQGAHVISISLGGLGAGRLRSAIHYAQKKGVIIAAAAGNEVRFVVWPAAYEEVIAVAACNAKREIWTGSCRGDAVDVTAPGESVWHAQPKKDDDGSIKFGMVRGSGTSFAVAAVAGIAALWLSHHGREKLIEKYGVEKIPFLFNQILRGSCDPVAGWEAGQFGTGLVNAEKVLAAPLPDQVEELSFKSLLDFSVDDVQNVADIREFRHLFEQSLPKLQVLEGGEESNENDLIEKHLADILGVKEDKLSRQLKEVGQELLFYFSTNPSAYKAFIAEHTQLTKTNTELSMKILSIRSVRTILLEGNISNKLREKLVSSQQQLNLGKKSMAQHILSVEQEGKTLFLRLYNSPETSSVIDNKLKELSPSQLKCDLSPADLNWFKKTLGSVDVILENSSVTNFGTN